MDGAHMPHPRPRLNGRARTELGWPPERRRLTGVRRKMLWSTEFAGLVLRQFGSSPRTQWRHRMVSGTDRNDGGDGLGRRPEHGMLGLEQLRLVRGKLSRRARYASRMLQKHNGGAVAISGRTRATCHELIGGAAGADQMAAVS